MDFNYPYKAGAKLKASSVNKLMKDSQFYTDSGVIGGGYNTVLSTPLNVQGMADITSSNIGEVYSHSIIYAVAQDDGNGFRWFRTRQEGSQAYYTIGNSQIECVGTVKGYDENGDPIVSDNENKVMVAVQPMVIGNKYVLRGQETLVNGMAAYWNGYKLVPVSGGHRREFVIQRTETNIQLPFDASGVKPDDGITGLINFGPEMLFSPLRPFTNQMLVIVETNGVKMECPSGWQSMTLPRADGGGDVDGALGPNGQFWMADTQEVGKAVPYESIDGATGLPVWRGFADPLWPTGIHLPGFVGPDGLPVPIGADTYVTGLDTPATYTESTERDYAEALYSPAPEEEEALGGYARVVFPVNYPPVQSTTIPNPLGYDTRGAHILGDAYTRGSVPYTDVPSAIRVSVTAGGFTACSMGLVELTVQSNSDVQVAKYAGMDRIKFEVYTTKSGDDTPLSAPPAYSHCYGLNYTWSRVTRLSDDDVHLFKCTGSYMPDPLGTNIVFSYDPLGSGGELFYQRRFSPSQENSYIKRWSNIHNSFKYPFGYVYDAPVEETIKVAPPTLPGCTFDSVQTHTEDEITTLKLRYKYGDKSIEIDIPDYEDLLSDEYGDIVFKSVDAQTGYLTYTFVPSRGDENGENIELGSLPFWYGFTRDRRMGITSKRAHAMKRCYPAFCPTLDKNEVLVPGEIYDFKIAKVSLTTKIHKSYIPGSDWRPGNQSIIDISDMVETEAVDFEYLILIPSEVYHTDIDCTPYTSTQKITYALPTVSEWDVNREIKENDLWLTTVGPAEKLLEDVEPHTIYYAVPSLKQSVVSVREPFGAFNDCANTESLAVFIKKDSNDIKYPCTCRLDYIPYGYALATKTPTCFYKATTTDNCAPKLKGVVYDIKRVEGKLLVNGGCYIPCSTLASGTKS